LFDIFIDSYDSSPLELVVVLMEESSAESWLKKGDEFFQQKRYEDALESYLNATDINPGCAAAWHNMGLICRILGQHEEAETCFERSGGEYENSTLEHLPENKPEIAEEPLVEEPVLYAAEDPEEVYGKGLRLSQNGQLDEALSIFEYLILLDPTDCRVWNSKGITLAKLGRYQEASRAFKQSLIINPSYQPAINNLKRIN
jgi:tetratricopeptide (TPR) repeat protein